MISKRSTQDPQDVLHKQVYLKAFGENIQLNLRPNRELNKRLQSMRMLAAETRDGGLKYRDEAMSAESIGRLYHDDEKMAAVAVRHQKDGRILLVSERRLWCESWRREE